jgi:hypothetical protein
VLLTSGNEDTTDPPSSAQADYAYYKAHCGCDVSQLLLADTAHLFMVHKSLPEWVDYVVNWLSSNGISGTPSGSASGSGGSGSKGPDCATATGRLKGLGLGALKLGFSQARARRTLTKFTVTRNGMDNFCLAHGRGIRAGYPSAKLLRSLSSRQRRQVEDKIVIALTANRHYALDGILPGTRLAKIKSRVRAIKPYRIGRNTWYVIDGKQSNGLLKVQHGVVEEVGILGRRLSHGRRATRRALTSFPDG